MKFRTVMLRSPDVNAAPVSAETEAKAKGMGALRDKRYPDAFNVRIVTGYGRVTSEQLNAVSEAASKFGSGKVALTTRLSFEIQGVPFDNIVPMGEFLKPYGLYNGGTGPKVRPCVSCKGTTCHYGLIDTYALAEEIHQRFYLGYHDVKLPHKFKIAVGGCPNNCVKPDINDIGIIGQKQPVINLDKCKGCKECSVAKACPVKVPTVENGKVVIDDEACNRCGRCANACPFGAVEDYIEGYRMTFGGRWGKRTARGTPLKHVFKTQDEVLDAIAKIIKYYSDNATPGERFADTVARIGIDKVEADIIG